MVVPLEMHWRDLLFANWPVPRETVAAHLPAALDVDTYDGEAWLSVVPFTNGSVRPRGVPEALGVSLPELNLRTYITMDGTPSVYFFSLDAEGILGVLGARRFHHLPYYYAKITHEQRGGVSRFVSRRRHPGARPVAFRATYEPTDGEVETGEGSLAAFLTERYRFYTEAPDGTVRYSNVSHDRWPLSPAEVGIEENTIFRANGFADPESEPVYYYSPGVEISASASQRRESTR